MIRSDDLMGRNNPRVLEWNVQLDPKNSPQSQHVIVLLVNKQREIERIKTRLFNATRPIDNLTVRANGKLNGEKGLAYECISFDTGTPQDAISWSDIYGGKIRKNRDLYEREKPDGLQKYVDQRMG